MIISKTPLRVSFVGGGTDLPVFCDVHGGAVVSTSIDKWIHVVVAPRFEGDLRVSYSRTEIVPSAESVEHELVREALRRTGLPRGLDVVTLADVPSHGTGLGSSSAVTAGLLNALYAYQSMYRSPASLAAEASEIEIDVLGKPIGRQDQYAASFGGFNLIEFLPRGGGVRVEPVVCSRDAVNQLHRSLLFFFTGRQRSADDVLERQQDAIQNGDAVAALQRMRDMAYEFRDRLAGGDVPGLGRLLHENWELKRRIAHGVSDPTIDSWYDAAMTAGATGGKLLGAGGGGFLLVLAPPENQAAVRAALRDLREVPLNFSARGTQIVLLEQHGPS
jgi:D-glycero-alpha-D-manno-heptose-7-phosphate kinase